MRPYGILETCLCAADLEATERFYTQVLGLEVIAHQNGRHVFFRCGQGVFLVFNPQVTATDTVYISGSLLPKHGTTGAGHMAFAVRESELSGWRERLKENGVPIESEIDWPGGGHSIYFRDPAKNLIELGTPRLWGLEEPPTSA